MSDVPVQDSPQSHTVDDLNPIARYFDVLQEVEAPRLATIARFLRGDNKEMDEIDLARALRNMMWKLGDPPLGSSPLDHAYEYAKLGRQIDEMTKERAKYER